MKNSGERKREKPVEKCSVVGMCPQNQDLSNIGYCKWGEETGVYPMIYRCL